MPGTAHRSLFSCGMLAAVLALAMSGCVGPNFVPPAAPAVDGYLPGNPVFMLGLFSIRRIRAIGVILSVACEKDPA